MTHYKPYPAYRDSGLEWIGQVPEHWQLSKVAWDMKMTIGWTPPTGNRSYYGGPYNWVSIADLSAGRISKTKQTLTDAAIAEMRGSQAPAGSLLFSYKLSIGEVAVLEEPAYTNEAIAAFHPCKRVSMSFWKYAAPVILPRYSRVNIYGSDLLNQELMNSARMAIPDIAEQRDIANCLDRETTRIDELIAKKTRFIELLKEKRQALITHAVTKGLNPNVKTKDSGVEWIGVVPEHWSVVQVRHVATLGSGHTPSRSRPDWWDDCCIPWFTLADIWQVRREGRRFVTETEEKVSELGIANSSAVVHPAGSVMLSRTASVGFPAIMGCDMATSQDFAVWRCGSRVVNEYLYLVLLGMKQELSRLMIGSTHKTIYMPDIEAFRMPLPPVEQQKEIIKYVGSETQRIDTVIAKTQRSIDLLKERRAAFITAAVTGQIDLRGAA